MHGDLDFETGVLQYCSLLSVAWATFLPILVFLRRFPHRSRLIGQYLTDASHDLVTLTLEVMALFVDMGLRAPSVYRV